MTYQGYMLFMAESPMIGLPDHPSSAPDADARPTDAASYAEAYFVHATEEEAEAEAAEDHESRLAAVEAGDLSDTDDEDVVLPVAVHDDGSLEIFAFGTDHPASSRHTAAEIYGAFGMTQPAPDAEDPGPEGHASHPPCPARSSEDIVTIRTATLEAFIRETHNRSPSLFVGAFELCDEEDLTPLLKEVSGPHDADARPCFVPQALGEDRLEDFDLQELLAARIYADAGKGFSLGALETDMRMDVQMAMERYLGVDQTMTYEAS